ncbi:bacteriocin [Streptococcus pneumoniae]|nr:bacteriocin [Streptococcus pneumoniae]VRG84715.1 bacteriocin [Streptococcus pneumoniae]VSV27436.1 bacteriocin [Streptococcus pneumoniae]
MENTEFSLELDVTEVATEQDYVSSGVTSTGLVLHLQVVVKTNLIIDFIKQVQVLAF